jgi:hypothetical protein
VHVNEDGSGAGATVLSKGIALARHERFQISLDGLRHDAIGWMELTALITSLVDATNRSRPRI